MLLSFQKCGVKKKPPFCKNNSQLQFQFIDRTNWAKRHPNCGGSEQSPIDLKTSGAGAVRNNSMANFSFAKAYFRPVSGKWVNNGHTGSTIDACLPYEAY